MKTVYTPDGNEVKLNAVDAKEWVNAKLATYEPPTVKVEPAKVEEEKALTVKEIKAALAEKGIEIPDGVTKKDDLQALLDSSNE